jgi:multiple sugar transport system ATP-binding protein
MNFMSGVLGHDDAGGHVLQLGPEVLQVPGSVLEARPALASYVGKPVIIGIRPEDIEDAALTGAAPGRTMNAVAELVEPLGSDIMVYLSVAIPPPAGHEDFAELAKDAAGDLPALADDRSTVIARLSPRSSVAVGDKVAITVATERLHFFDPTSGAAVWSS